MPVKVSQSTGSFLCEIKLFLCIGGWGPPLGEKGCDCNYPHWPGKWDMWINFRGPRKEFEDKPYIAFIILAPLGSNLGAQEVLSEVLGMKMALIKNYS